jgi:hypothetical protein
MYNIYYRIMYLQKTKLNTLGSIAVERSSSASEHQVGKVEYTYGWYSASVDKI